MRANSPKQRCPALWLPLCWSCSATLSNEDVLFSNQARGSREDNLFSWPGMSS